MLHPHYCNCSFLFSLPTRMLCHLGIYLANSYRKPHKYSLNHKDVYCYLTRSAEGGGSWLPRTQSLAIILLHHPQHCGFSILNSSPHGHKLVAVVPAIKLLHNTTCSRMEEVVNGALPPHACLYIRAEKLSQNLLSGCPIWFIGQN